MRECCERMRRESRSGGGIEQTSGMTAIKTDDPNEMVCIDYCPWCGQPIDLPQIKIRRLHHSAKIPAYKTKEAAGMDLHACLPGDSLPEDFRLEPRGRLRIPTGLAIQIPPGYEGQIRPRSGLALEHGVTVLNAPGTLDSDYRGEVGVLLINHGQDDFWVKNGDRIAQLVVAKVEQADVLEVSELDETERGAGGFGSTGKS